MEDRTFGHRAAGRPLRLLRDACVAGLTALAATMSSGPAAGQNSANLPTIDVISTSPIGSSTRA